MASKTLSTVALLLSLNLLFFTMVTSTHVPCPPPPSKHHNNPPKSPPSKSPPAQAPPSKSPPAKATCPKDTLKLGVCGDLLNDLVNVVVGTPPKTPCCSLIEGLVDLEAAVCLCTAIEANVLGINLNVPVSLSLLLNYCGKSVPSGFKCAPKSPPAKSPPSKSPPAKSPPAKSPPAKSPPSKSPPAKSPPAKSPPSKSPPAKATCPKDTLKLGVCADLLNDLVNVVVGTPPKTPCCSLIEGLVDLEAAVCLCTAIKANVLGINLNVPVSLSLLLDYCGKSVPSGFKCA